MLYQKFWLRNIPDTMKKLGFHVAASLQERWFAGEAWEMQEDQKKVGKAQAAVAGHPERVYVPSAGPHQLTITWANGNLAAAAALQRLVATWNSKKTASTQAGSTRYDLAADSIKTFIKTSIVGNPQLSAATAVVGPGYSVKFDFEEMKLSLPQLDALAIQREDIAPSLLGGIDDFVAAVYKASWKLVVCGKCEYVALEGIGPRLRVSVDKVGIFLRDTYDFTGPQYLGNWSSSGVQYLPIPPPIEWTTPDTLLAAPDKTHYVVDNISYRRFRSVYNKGGDFFVFSDVMWMSPASNPPDWLEFIVKITG